MLEEERASKGSHGYNHLLKPSFFDVGTTMIIKKLCKEAPKTMLMVNKKNKYGQ